MPVLVKDNIDVAGLSTTAGSLALRDALDRAHAGVDAIVTAPGALTVLGARAGYPELVVHGLALHGPAFSEVRLLAFGRELERSAPS